MRSAIAPWITGIIAPPTIAIFIRPDPLPVSGPSSATPRVKMLGNMMELKSPTAIMLHIARCPLVSMETVTSAGAHREQALGLEPPQRRSAQEAPHHRASPIERDIPGRDLWRDARDVGLTAV